MTREAYHRQLGELAQRVVSLGSAVWDNVGRATHSLMDYDLGAVDDVIDADDRIDEIARRLEDEAVQVLAREAPVASELTYVTSLLRLAYELERCGDLMVNVARTVYRLGGPLPDGRVKELLGELGAASRAILQRALGTYATGEELDLREADDTVDDAYTRLLRELTTPGTDPRIIIALTIAGRCFERVADHAVNLAERSSLVVRFADV